ncbi:MULTISPECIES: 50S ribosomal protein L24 [Mumia]|uniref:50S ribosomal protein L24 n=1 Tax=Mumia TaxID=1546255 RepID=UPI001AB02B8F|nr:MULTISPECIES: 50S ribosomal protein L24 [unclassified Mumia]
MTVKKSLNIKKGDHVRVLSGKDRGVEGKVIAVNPETERVIVEGVNRIKRHQKALQPGTTSSIITKEAPIHVSNVALLVEVDGEKVPTRVGFRRDDVTKKRADGSTYTAQRSVRVAKRTGEEI